MNWSKEPVIAGSLFFPGYPSDAVEVTTVRVCLLK